MNGGLLSGISENITLRDRKVPDSSDLGQVTLLVSELKLYNVIPLVVTR